MIPRPLVSRRSKVRAWVSGLLTLGNRVYFIYLKGEGLWRRRGAVADLWA
jgi:hypothetical protein